jgi:16S rRNA G966 N2-methylase RsmD
LKAENAQIVNADALQFLANNSLLFDVVFLDPPYQQGWLDKALPVLHQYLSEDGLAYVEAEYALVDTPDWKVLKQGKAGNVFYHLLSPVRIADIA